MITDKFALKLFFHDVLEEAVRDLRENHSRIGFAASKLMEDMCVRQDPFLDRIINDYTGDSREYRLNGAGLKMYMKITGSGSDRRFLCSIAGDQARDYEWFVGRFKALVKKHGCCKLQWRDIRNQRIKFD